MVTETDGIILRQTKIARDRKMLVLFTRKFGKISAGTGIRQSGKKIFAPAQAFYARPIRDILRKDFL